MYSTHSANCSSVTNVHPYAKLSLSVGLLNPAGQDRQAIFAGSATRSWIGYTFDSSPPMMRSKTYRVAFDEANTELVSGEVLRFPSHTKSFQSKD